MSSKYKTAMQYLALPCTSYFFVHLSFHVILGAPALVASMQALVGKHCMPGHQGNTEALHQTFCMAWRRKGVCCYSISTPATDWLVRSGDVF